MVFFLAMSTKRFSITVFTLVFLSGFVTELNADTIYLKNGRSIEGLIKSEDNNSVELEIKIGTIRLRKNEIERIYKSTPDESYAILKKWERQRLEAQEKRLIEELKKEFEPKKIEFSKEPQGIVVDAILNKKIPASLILDTGASLVIITKEVAKKLGIDVDKKDKVVKLIMADGRMIEAKYIVLESIGVQNVELENVDAAILLDDEQNLVFKDGLLGASFLNKFSFKVDYKNSRLILEKSE